MASNFFVKGFSGYVIRFMLLFGFLYLGSLAIIGLTAPGNYYSSFVDKYLDLISWLRDSLLAGTKIILSFFGIETYYANEYVIRKVNGRGVRLVYSCLGYGVMSFWIAFTLATSTNWKRKLCWMFGGLIMIWLINVLRISLLLVATNNNWPIPFGWDHHTWFNIAVYTAIFILMYFFSKVPFFADNNNTDRK